MKALSEKRNKVEVISDSHGRAVRLSINGSITFFYWYRWNGKAVQLTIGDYPFASLSYSREQGLQCRPWLAEGGDSRRQTLCKQQRKTMLSPPKTPSFTVSLKGL
ncbi:Arm DNA-binding domain-containing protein [Klebsiella michiganensis]|uniref:Arm DNA-binding domain-containing protein n=1 Tax=Klebsiella michiganensis TaxID=1134687 RepID=UPI003B984379